MGFVSVFVVVDVLVVIDLSVCESGILGVLCYIYIYCIVLFLWWFICLT